MKGEHILTVVLVALLFVVALQTVQLLGLKSMIAGDTLVTGTGAGETYEQMMERMHGSSSGSSASSSAGTGMVGGC